MPTKLSNAVGTALDVGYAHAVVFHTTTASKEDSTVAAVHKKAVVRKGCVRGEVLVPSSLNVLACAKRLSRTSWCDCLVGAVVSTSRSRPTSRAADSREMILGGGLEARSFEEPAEASHIDLPTKVDKADVEAFAGLAGMVVAVISLCQAQHGDGLADCDGSLRRSSCLGVIT